MTGYELDNKDRGHIAGLKLAVQLESRGYIALWPEGDNRCFDLVVLSRRNKFSRIQVKSCWKKDDRGRYGFVVKRGTNHSKTYTPKDIDVMALHAFDGDAWYFIPVAEIKDLDSIHIGPNSKWTKFKDNWEVFD